MASDIIAWHFHEKKEKSLYIKKDIVVDKYTFHQTTDALSEEEFQERRRSDSSIERDGFLLTVSWNIPSNTTNVEKDTQEELEKILEIISLYTNYLFGIETSIHTSNDGRKEISGISVLESEYTELTEKIIRDSIRIKEKIDSIEDEDKARFLKYALTWYRRGLQEHDIANAYASYWIGFETLSFWFEPDFKDVKCEKCGQIIYEKSIGKRMREFVEKLKIENIDKKIINQLYSTRSKLFHNSIDDITIKDTHILQNLLKNCIFACTNQIN